MDWCGNPNTLNSSLLDDKMLPSGIQTNLSKRMKACYSEDQALEVLKRVRANLPEGSVLPEGVKEILQLHYSISVI